MQTLKILAKAGRTIIMSIHSPRSEIWGLFDRAILLSLGSTIYSGPADEAVAYFASCGHQLPPFVNPAEFFIDLAAVDLRRADSEKESNDRVQALREACAKHARGKLEEEVAAGKASPGVRVEQSAVEAASLAGSTRGTPFARQLAVLTRRAIKVAVRDPLGIAASLVEAVCMGILAGLIFYKMGFDDAGIRSREGAIYVTLSLQGYLIIMFEVFRLTFDIQLFDREHREGVVGVNAFLLSRRISRFFLEDFPVPTLFALIFYFMSGLRYDVATFFLYLTISIISHLIVVLTASACVAGSRSFAVASLSANMVYTLQSFCCGYFIQVQQMPVYVRWLKWVVSEHLSLLHSRFHI